MTRGVLGRSGDLDSNNSTVYKPAKKPAVGFPARLRLREELKPPLLSDATTDLAPVDLRGPGGCFSHRISGEPDDGGATCSSMPDGSRAPNRGKLGIQSRNQSRVSEVACTNRLGNTPRKSRGA